MGHKHKLCIFATYARWQNERHQAGPSRCRCNLHLSGIHVVCAPLTKQIRGASGFHRQPGHKVRARCQRTCHKGHYRAWSRLPGWGTARRRLQRMGCRARGTEARKLCGCTCSCGSGGTPGMPVSVRMRCRLLAVVADSVNRDSNNHRFMLWYCAACVIEVSEHVQQVLVEVRRHIANC
jgi:hypothetical protein